MKLINQSKFESTFLNKGFIIKKSESKKSLSYINNLIKKNFLKILKLNISAKKFNLNNLHLFLKEKNLNKVRLNLINLINKDKKFKKYYF